ncbi:hypothetical protein OG828_07610 [Streptomyces sp. NBC_00457]|uniref:Rv1733c family protein n=1 Tax=Streptomyces sp. NBC_00457 TaxID=2975748 RepID=UPI002E23D973
MGSRRTNRWLWQWRSNPLRRRDDIIEAWIVLAVWMVISVGGVLVGLITARVTDEMLAGQRSARYPVEAVLLTTVPRIPSAVGGVSDLGRAEVSWTAADGSIHTGKTLIDAGRQSGSKVVVWVDSRGELTAEPASATEAAVEAGVLGTAAALAVVARRRLDRRRISQWDREWEPIGPRWGHRQADPSPEHG